MPSSEGEGVGQKPIYHCETDYIHNLVAPWWMNRTNMSPVQLLHHLSQLWYSLSSTIFEKMLKTVSWQHKGKLTLQFTIPCWMEAA